MFILSCYLIYSIFIEYRTIGSSLLTTTFTERPLKVPQNLQCVSAGVRRTRNVHLSVLPAQNRDKLKTWREGGREEGVRGTERAQSNRGERRQSHREQSSAGSAATADSVVALHGRS